MDKKKFFTLGIVLLLAYSCNNKGEGFQANDNNLIISRDTLMSSDIIEDLKNGLGELDLTYLDKYKNIIEGIDNNNDTFFIKLNYKSEIYKALAQNYNLEVNSLSKNCRINKMNDEFRMIVNSNQLIDTIEYEVYLMSPNYLFKSTDANNRIFLQDKIRLVTFYETFSLRK